jgi:hypothetical protein
MHRYKYTIILLLTFVVAWAIGRLGVVEEIAKEFSQSNQVLYTFFSGAMYSFSFTAGFSVLFFSKMDIAQQSLMPLALIAALGGLLADLLIFKFVKNVLFEELGPKVKALIAKSSDTKFERIFYGCIGALIIASPFPDEIGLTFMGVSKIKFWELVVLTYILDVIGSYIIISAVANVI